MNRRIFTDSPWTGPTDQLASDRSPNWAFWERFEVPDYDRPERNYLTRLRIVQTPFFGIYLHKFDGPDPRPTLHDHPWPFVSFILKGSYREQRPARLHHRKWVNVMRTGDVHYIYSIVNGPVWSLMFVGRRRRKWGYVEPTDDGFKWTAFDRHPHSLEFVAALRERSEGGS